MLLHRPGQAACGGAWRPFDLTRPRLTPRASHTSPYIRAAAQGADPWAQDRCGLRSALHYAAMRVSGRGALLRPGGAAPAHRCAAGHSMQRTVQCTGCRAALCHQAVRPHPHAHPDRTGRGRTGLDCIGLNRFPHLRPPICLDCRRRVVWSVCRRCWTSCPPPQSCAATWSTAPYPDSRRCTTP